MVSQATEYEEGTLGAAMDVAAKKSLVAEISKTALGRFLLADLKRRNITLIVTSDMSAAATDFSTAGAYWDPASRRVVLSGNAPLAKQLHFFAHETRHSAQHDIDMADKNASEILHPVNFLLRNRLQEMDADAFAVFFVANHAIEAKSEHFDTLYRTEKPPLLFGFFSLSEEKVDRSYMYRAFLDSLKGHDKDMTRAMRAAAVALFEEPLINKIYDARCVHNWNEKIWPHMVETSKTPEGPAAQKLRQVFQRFRSKKFKSPQEDLVAHAKAYSKIYAEAGSPDYLEGIYERIFDFLAKEAKGADRVWDNEMPALKDRFNEAADYYLSKVPKASAKKLPKRKTRPLKAAA